MKNPRTGFTVETVTCFIPIASSEEMSVSNSSRLSFTYGIMGSILAVTGNPVAAIFCSAMIRFSGAGALGSIRFAVSLL